MAGKLFTNNFTNTLFSHILALFQMAKKFKVEWKVKAYHMHFFMGFLYLCNDKMELNL